MKTLSGQGFGTVAVMGRAARLLVENGRATLDESLLGQLAQWRRKEEVPMGLILVAEDPATALLLPLPEGAALNGVLSERLPSRPPQLPEGVALLAGVEEALLAVGEGELLLLEPARGRAVVEPSAFEVARLQARHQPRILLDEPNFPAFTMEGSTVAVWGYAESLTAAHDAVTAGADGLFLTGSWSEDDLWAAQDRIGGGALAIAIPLAEIDPEIIVRLAARSQLRWCLAPDALALPVEQLRTELRELVAELEEENQRAVVPRLASLSGPTPGFEDAIVLGSPLPTPDTETPLWEQPPLYVRVVSAFGELLDLDDALYLGAAGVLADPESIPLVKQHIREA